MGTLSIVATPIGNLEDITFRAVRTLRDANYIYCEDTRTTRNVCTKYDITTPLRSLNAHTEEGKIAEIIALVEEGNNVAYVSDAGTPCISDPGIRLVSAARNAGVAIEAIPGASALIAALSIAGIDTSSFTFYGFLPHKKGRQTRIQEIAEESRTVVLYESTHRIVKLLESFANIIPERRVCLARELTKMHEEVLCGTAHDLLRTLSETPEKQKGEFVVIVAA